jgi:hypothetical protein
VESQRGDERRDEQFVKPTGSTSDESQKANRSTPANMPELPVECRKGEKGEELKGVFGFRNRIRLERPSDIAGRQLVSTRVPEVSAQNFAAFQRKCWNATLCMVLAVCRRHFLPNTDGRGNPGSFHCLSDSVAGRSRLAVVRDILSDFVPRYIF